MTNIGKDITTASFFENGTTEQFDFCYKLYPQVLKLKAEKRNKKPQELIRLDQWYQNELPKLIKARGKDAHIVYDELVQTMKWKQARGKFYPQLSYLVKVNTPRAVMQETKKAFRKLPNLEQAIMALSNLKGVGTTMASALLAAASPDSAPFMADECLLAIPEIEGIDYTTKEYLNFVHHIQTTVERLNMQDGGDQPVWSPHRVELALWAHYVANDLNPELLEQMPNGKGGTDTIIGKENGNINVNNNTSEDSHDGDILACVDRIGAESETENESIIPITHDGDSNFVSNDSTSQESILDENTIQTIATTTTEDGDVGADSSVISDSESNLELISNLNAKTNTINTHNNSNNSSLEYRDLHCSMENTTMGGLTGNSNGILLTSVLTIPVPGLDSSNDNCNCIRESTFDADESSNSNNKSHVVLPLPLIIHKKVNNDANTVSTPSSTVSIGLTPNICMVNTDTVTSVDDIHLDTGNLKRVHACGDADGLIETSDAQPEMKKVRSV